MMSVVGTKRIRSSISPRSVVGGKPEVVGARPDDQIDPKRHLHEPLRGLESKRLARDGKSHDGLYSSGHKADRGYRLEVESIGT